MVTHYHVYVADEAKSVEGVEYAARCFVAADLEPGTGLPSGFLSRSAANASAKRKRGVASQRIVMGCDLLGCPLIAGPRKKGR